MTYKISDDQMFDIADARRHGESWASIGFQYGMQPMTVKAAYLRQSADYCSLPRRLARFAAAGEPHAHMTIHAAQRRDATVRTVDAAIAVLVREGIDTHTILQINS